MTPGRDAEAERDNAGAARLAALPPAQLEALIVELGKRSRYANVTAETYRGMSLAALAAVARDYHDLNDQYLRG